MRRVLLVGAGEAGQAIAADMISHRELGMLPVGFIDDNPSDSDQHLCKLPILGTRQALSQVAESQQVEQVVIALPWASGKTIREIVDVCKRLNLQPSIVAVNGGEIGSSPQRLALSYVRDVQIEDLLRSKPIRASNDGLRETLAGRRTLVTGAGGSIGSELCRQIAQYDPAKLVLLGHGEHSIFTLANELARLYPSLRTVPVIADVRDRDRLERRFADLRPQIVFHAAAHKHVPLMEQNVEEAISNNVLGTDNLVKTALASGVEKFILVSTDKAVNPASVMGASKRVGELIVSQAAHRTGRCFVSVRFGNVIGSRGSVLSLFREQISHGGPVTVTHPEMRRYFMTIHEAVELILQAIKLGKGGEIFVLEMGEPVKIADIDRYLIELSGFKLGRDISIQFTGARPGEKLFEELLLQPDHYEDTQNPKIFVLRNGFDSWSTTESQRPNQIMSAFDEKVAALIEAARLGDRRLIQRYLMEIIPDYVVEAGSVTYVGA